MLSNKTPLILALANVRTNHGTVQLSRQFPHVHHQRDPDVLNETDLLGTCQLFEQEDEPTVGFLYVSYIPGRPYEDNLYAQRDIANLELDVDIRSYIKNDSQWNRELHLREALQDLRRQTSLEKFDEITIHTTHSKHFNENGSFFEILRKFFVIQENRTFNLNMQVGKKYLDFISLHDQFNVKEANAQAKEENYFINSSQNLQNEEFEITERNRHLMLHRLRQRA